MLNDELVDALLARLVGRIANGDGNDDSQTLLNAIASRIPQSPAIKKTASKSASFTTPVQICSKKNENQLKISPLPQKKTGVRFRNESDSLSRSSSLTTLDYSSSTEDPQEQEESQFPDVEDDVEDDFDQSYDAIKMRRGAKVHYLPEDKLVVNLPIMRHLDSRLLAPVQTVLFQHGRKKDGSFKKRPHLVFDKLKEEIKPVVRKLVAKAKGPSANLHHRYFWCAYDLIRKRRANHIQSWRNDKVPKELIYGGREQFISTYGDPWSVAPKNRKRKRRTRKLFDENKNSDAKNTSTKTQPVVPPMKNLDNKIAVGDVGNEVGVHQQKSSIITKPAQPVLKQDGALPFSRDPFDDDGFDILDQVCAHHACMFIYY